MRIAILGGSGNAGRAVAELLATRTDVEILLLGRDGDRARQVAAAIGRGGRARVSARTVDALAGPGLREAARDVDLVIVASSTTQHAGRIAAAILEGGSDYYDINLSSPHKLAALRELEPRILESGRCFITDGGVHPGLPGLLVRWAAARAPLESAAVAARFDIDWRSLRFSAETRREFAAELFDFDPSVLKGGRWQRGTRHSREFNLGAPFGDTVCVPMCMEEIRELPAALPGLRDVGFWVAGFGARVDYVIMPIAFGMARISRRLAEPASRLLAWGLQRYASRQGGCVAVLEAHTQAGVRVHLRLSHPDAYVFTAAPVVATLFQVLGGRRTPGLRTQASFADPVRFLADLASLGIEVSGAGPEPSDGSVPRPAGAVPA